MRPQVGDTIIWHEKDGKVHTAYISRVDEDGFSYQWDIWDSPESTSWAVWENWQRIHGIKVDDTCLAKRIMKSYGIITE